MVSLQGRMRTKVKEKQSKKEVYCSFYRNGSVLTLFWKCSTLNVENMSGGGESIKKWKNGKVWEAWEKRDVPKDSIVEGKRKVSHM